MRPVGIPIIIFILCFCVGAVGSGQLLPDLAAGPVGGLAFFAVCGLLGAALGLVGLHTWLIVDSINHWGGGGGRLKSEIIAEGLTSILFDGGVLLGLAAGVYLLAPPPEESSDPAVSTAAPS